jgi:hypothetical protein
MIPPCGDVKWPPYPQVQQYPISPPPKSPLSERHLPSPPTLPSCIGRAAVSLLLPCWIVRALTPAIGSWEPPPPKQHSPLRAPPCDRPSLSALWPYRRLLELCWCTVPLADRFTWLLNPSFGLPPSCTSVQCMPSWNTVPSEPQPLLWFKIDAPPHRPVGQMPSAVTTSRAQARFDGELPSPTDVGPAKCGPCATVPLINFQRIV